MSVETFLLVVSCQMFSYSSDSLCETITTNCTQFVYCFAVKHVSHVFARCGLAFCFLPGRFAPHAAGLHISIELWSSQVPGQRMAKSWTVVSQTTRFTTHTIGLVADNTDKPTLIHWRIGKQYGRWKVRDILSVFTESAKHPRRVCQATNLCMHRGPNS